MSDRKPLSPSEIADILFDQIKPFIKGFPEEGQPIPFRKSLTSEESQELLNTIHNIIATIRIDEQEGLDSVCHQA